MFFEEWELLTEPLLLQALPMVNLSGIAIQEDEYVQTRQNIENEFEAIFVEQNATEIFEDVFDRVKTPTPPLPNMRDPETFKHYFE